ncbi:MAG TPA: ATP-binding cassette domain-containing protein [Candidatus Ventrousia excrementavium]|uniref:ATP-binding cassette domain-containing protein n=1 Tax=Candidatus Ventrousia excrementavium TaxID=2840961 RepID=A0A9D1IVY2_9CLOT|nr:ATP-binding cassette domain-containing protein [Candidatus Ventrousia excrementavium]
MTPAFSIEDLTFRYPGQEAAALDGLSLAVNPGEFLVLCGPSGCGKSTLLRQLKTVLAPHGQRAGRILFEGRPLESVGQREQAQRIGFVGQSPDNQLATDKVWHELAFGLESLGYDTPAIRRRVAEMASFFGIQTWFYRDVAGLSGGQKQLLNLAAVMVMGPSVLVLDEPTSQLDPIAASELLGAVGKINRELGVTVILTEHRLEEALPLATRAAVMDRGRLLCAGTPAEVGRMLRDAGHGMFLSMPTAMRVWAAVDSDAPCPVTVRDGRAWLDGFAAAHPLRNLPEEQVHSYPPEPVLSAGELWFRYEKDGADIVRGLSLTVQKGEWLALLGGNGTGKTTSLKLLAGLLKPWRGEVCVRGSVGTLPQNPQALFVKKTVREDLYEIFEGSKRPREERDAAVARVTALCRLGSLLDRHPYDLSGGEQQRAALAKTLLLEPEILLLDEPTKGLDAEFKQVLAEILQALLRRGVTIVMVSHDIEFCARYAHRCALFFDGSIVTEGMPRAFFSGNSFYTTAANRMARAWAPEAVTAEDVIAACGGRLPPQTELPDETPPLPPPAQESPDWRPPALPWWRKLGAALSGAAAVLLLLRFIGVSDLSALIGADGITPLAARELPLYAVFFAALLIFAACISRRSPAKAEQSPRERRRLPRRTIAAAVLILLLVPLTLLMGVVWLDSRRYYLVSVLILLETMLPFFLVFEGRKPRARELVVIAVLCALGVAGRAVFFMLPQFKPVMAIAIVAGVAFGGETGFLVGAMTMLTSNVLYGQGPWTPWQMFAMGIVGFLAGVLFKRGLLRRSRASLCAFGALTAVVVYGGIVNLGSALIGSPVMSADILLTYYVTGLPMDCVHAAATWIFLWFGALPMLEKLDRIKVKYGLVE